MGSESDAILTRNYWIEALKPVNGGRIEAAVNGNTITINTTKQSGVAVWLDPTLVDFKKPVEIVVDGKKKSYKLSPSLETYCEGLEQTADPKLAAAVRIVISP